MAGKMSMKQGSFYSTALHQGYLFNFSI